MIRRYSFYVYKCFWMQETLYIHPQDKTKVIVKVGENFINLLNQQDVKMAKILTWQ